ncbi:hypothetical protein MROS_2535 [Melioribacter roseus P3M-2]|uniref:Uncharacterized protein n=2 Tax=Melioribacter roseus TaxID=1134405 RepID=I6Z9E9_MELRP|nr:hypothetical protein MROS_2535 [Melioribacter roseus P3M-2]
MDSASYLPILINSNVFLDPELTDEEKIIIALAQTFRMKMMGASQGEQKRIAESLTASKFAAHRNVHRDHLRRTLRKMQSNPAVQKYVTIYFLKKGLNQEDQVIFHFKDTLPDSIGIKNPEIKNKLKNKIPGIVGKKKS